MSFSGLSSSSDENIAFCTFPDHTFLESLYHQYYLGDKTSKIISHLTRLPLIQPTT